MKSSPNDSHGFVTFESGGSKPARPAVNISAFRSEPFRYGNDFWNWVRADQTLGAELEVRISERVNTRVETLRRDMESSAHERVAERLSEAKIAGRTEGFEFGKNEGRQQAITEKSAELAAVISTLEGVIDKLLQSKEKVLHSHESAWLETLEYILIHCLVPRESEVIRKVQQWLSHELSEFSRMKGVTLSVSARQFGNYQSALSNAGSQNLILRVDDTLFAGDFRVECDNGGILFSDREALERLREAVRSVVAGTVVDGNDGNSV